MLKNNPSLLRGLARAFGITGDEESPARLSDSIAVVSEIYRQPEHALLRDEILAWGYGTSAAGGVGTRSHVQLWLPTTARKVCVVERIYVNFNGEYYVLIYGTALTTLVNLRGTRDLRTVTSWLLPDRKIETEIRTQAPASTTGLARALAYGRMWHETGGLMLAPGSGVQVCPTADNTAITVCFEWRERDALPGESVGVLR